MPRPFGSWYHLPVLRPFRIAVLTIYHHPFRTILPIALLFFALLLATGGPPPEPVTKPLGVEVEVSLADGGTLRLRIVDPKLELVTKYGPLQVPVADVRRIELATRVPVADAERCTKLIGKLNDPDFKVREDATVELKGMLERSYPVLVRYKKAQDDPETARRVDDCVRAVRNLVPAERLEVRDLDVVYTDDSKISGRLSAEFVRVETTQFGSQELKLTDVRSLRAAGAGAVAGLPVAPAPGNMAAYGQQVGKEFVFSLTGGVPVPNAVASVWGTDVYTVDSQLALAAVHAGVAEPGATVTVRVRVLASPVQFAASLRNNVSSASYGHYQQGAYEFVRTTK